jgi:hypothetical protein
MKDQNLEVVNAGTMGVTFIKSNHLTGCILKSGIMIAQTPPQLERNFKKDVIETWRSIMIDGMGLPQDSMPSENELSTP